MIAKNKKGKSFGGCVRYVMNEGCEILAAEGVLAEDAESIIRDFAIQRSGRPEIKQPVGHIAISFSLEDAPRLTNDFLCQLADEYKQGMNIVNTQYIIVRHHNTENPHIHIVYNRIDNDLKLISVNNDYKRNIKLCKKLKDKYNLTYGKGKEKVNRHKLTGADKVKYEIYDQIVAILPKCNSYKDLEKRLAQGGITIQYKYRSGAEESEENIQGISFRKGNYAFKGSEIDRKFSHGNLKKTMSANLNESWEKMKDLIMPEVKTQPKPTRSVKRRPVIRGVELTAEQHKTLWNGGYIFLENMEKKDGSGKFSAYVFLNDEKKKAFFSKENPDKMVECGSVTIRLRDKIQVERGHVVKAKMKWWGGIDFQHPFVWKKPDDNDNQEVEYSFIDPRIPKVQLEKEKQVSENFRHPPAVNRTVPQPRTVPSNRTAPQQKKGPKIKR